MESSRKCKVQDTESFIVEVDEVRRFMIECFRKANVPEEHAIAQTNLLLTADIRGHFSHGLNRLDMYINDILLGSQDANATPEILSETSATAWVDGKNGLGAVVGDFSMKLAIEKAKVTGVGWVCAKNSNHYGIAGYYALQAEKEGMIGMSMTNAAPLLGPTRAKTAALGTNPIALAAPANNDDNFVLDMATTTVALGKIEMNRRKGISVGESWALGPDGCATTDANVAFETACLTPLGGSEANSGYKGYGLSAMVEILCGVSAGSNYGLLVPKWTLDGAETKANLGQVFIAVNPSCFAPGFTDRMSDLNNTLRQMEPADPEKPVLVAGDPERMHKAKVEYENGICYHPNQIEACNVLADRLDIQKLKYQTRLCENGN